MVMWSECLAATPSSHSLVVCVCVLDIVYKPILSNETPQGGYERTVWWTRSSRSLFHVRAVANDGQIHRKTEVNITAAAAAAITFSCVNQPIFSQYCQLGWLPSGKPLWSVVLLLCSQFVHLWWHLMCEYKNDSQSYWSACCCLSNNIDTCNNKYFLSFCAKFVLEMFNFICWFDRQHISINNKHINIRLD